MNGWRLGRARGGRRVLLGLLVLGLLLAPGLVRAQPAGGVVTVLLPAEGTGGLEAGAEVHVLGLRAGTVRRVAFAPQRRLVAEIAIDVPEAREFIRRDSPVLIRARPGGGAQLAIGPGSGPPFDPAAGLVATLAPSPEAAMLGVLERLQGEAAPMLADIGRIARFAAVTLDRVERGEGTLGRLLAEDDFARNANEAARELTTLLRGGAQLVERMDRVAAQAERLMAESGGAGGSLPQLVRRVDQALANLQAATRDVQRAAQRLPQTLRNVEEGAGNVPGLLLQTQQATRELELLLAQLRGMWLLGGSGPPAPEPARPASERLRP
jgi:phospholipid/cholesterol/gamma-HCH transport system substrate-binding protein